VRVVSSRMFLVQLIINKCSRINRERIANRGTDNFKNIIMRISEGAVNEDAQKH